MANSTRAESQNSDILSHKAGGRSYQYSPPHPRLPSETHSTGNYTDIGNTTDEYAEKLTFEKEVFSRLFNS